jgi:hypothetical protein
MKLALASQEQEQEERKVIPLRKKRKENVS